LLQAGSKPLAADRKAELSVQGLARLVGRDIKRVRENVGILPNLGLLVRTDSGGVVCPYTSMHIDMYMN
jgi:predicted transcriptional regulator